MPKTELSSQSALSIVAGHGPNVSPMPVWIRQQLGQGTHFGSTRDTIKKERLHTVCEEACCPNRGECWSRGTATFMLLGDTCTRACGFCAVKTGRPDAVDFNEPQRVAMAVRRLGLRYVVLTSVNRDELHDGGAGIFTHTLQALRQQDARIGVEYLTPDFYRRQDNAVAAVQLALDNSLYQGKGPRLVWGHNIETVPRLYRYARKGSDYQRSLFLLRRASAMQGVEAKSALMLGLGETRAEVMQVLQDLRAAGVQRLSLGQYLRPSMRQLPVSAYIHPELFQEYEAAALDMGFEWVKAGPLVRSSYHAEE
ncbi:MAG: lipoyl synthase [Gammaproteobacteria bacterium]|nr:MAG: lipoyl synthase [Gammaproteobacteria bacterium]